MLYAFLAVIALKLTILKEKTANLGPVHAKRTATGTAAKTVTGTAAGTATGTAAGTAARITQDNISIYVINGAYFLVPVPVFHILL